MSTSEFAQRAVLLGKDFIFNLHQEEKLMSLGLKI